MSWGNLDDFQGFSESEEPRESQCSAWQMSIIESLLVIAAIEPKEKDLIASRIESYSEQEAKEVIEYLNENKIETDCRKQWEQWIKRTN